MCTERMPGVFPAKKKSGEIYYRASITYLGKHISLGSYSDIRQAHCAYKEARTILNQIVLKVPDDYPDDSTLSFQKWISLVNYYQNGIYIKNPIYLKKDFFIYYLSMEEPLMFDIDDLFYYSEHKIMKRNGHLFVSDYGMQVTILSRYGIKNYSIAGKDYMFKNGNTHDFRYENIEVINPYNGVRKFSKNNQILYQSRIHVNGDYIIGTYTRPEEAAIAYNKAIDILKAAGSPKNYQPNYIDNMTGKEYAEIYSQLKVSPKLFYISYPK